MIEIFDNIRKLYRFKAPSAGLEKYIEFFSESDLATTQNIIGEQQFSIKLFPSYTPTIWINLGTDYTLKSGKLADKVGKSKSVLVLRNQILERQNHPNDNIFTIKFRPCGFEAIFGKPQSVIGGKLQDATELLGVDIRQKVIDLQDLDSRVAYFEQLFFERLLKAKKEQSRIAKINSAIEHYVSSGMELRTAKLASEIYVTEKSLYRYFVNNVGTSPKNYLNNLRIRASLEKYLHDSHNFSVYDFGYYDLSHFYKSYEQFTGEKFRGAKLSLSILDK